MSWKLVFQTGFHFKIRNNAMIVKKIEDYSRKIFCMHKLMIVENTQEGQHKSLNLSKDYVGRMNRFIREHYMENISMMDVSASVFLSSNYANLRFTQKYGCTISKYITKCRITEAKKLLSETDLRVTRIGEMVGYNTRTSFYLAFMHIEGMSPRDYRKSVRNTFLSRKCTLLIM